ncbi:MAG: succinylglutamate desuccinylase/aspartoacylase family protein [Candidatus Competibacterales bacterium]
MGDGGGFNGIGFDADAVAPGGRRVFDLPLPNLYTHAQLSMPIQVLQGKHKGPRLFISAALHGDEINGVEIIRRLLALPLLKRLRGTLVAVPVVNLYGFLSQTRYLPDRRDLNRSFPGSETGSLAARLAHAFSTQVVAKADIGIDLHTGALHRTNLPQIRASLAHPETRRLAQAFGAPVILDGKAPEGSLRAMVDYPLLVFEGGEALRFDEFTIRAGVRGVIRTLRALEMLPPAKDPGRLPAAVVARSSHWLRAPQSGILRTTKPLGAQVEAGEVLAYVSDPFGEREAAVSSPQAGLVIGCSQIPLVHEGEALFHIAQVGRPGALADTVEQYHEALAEMTELADPHFAEVRP